MIERQNVGALEESKEITDDVLVGAGEQVSQQRLMLAMQLHEVVHVDGAFGEAQDGDDFVELVELQAEKVSGGGRTGTDGSPPQLRFSPQTHLFHDLDQEYRDASSKWKHER